MRGRHFSSQVEPVKKGLGMEYEVPLFRHVHNYQGARVLQGMLARKSDNTMAVVSHGDRIQRKIEVLRDGEKKMLTEMIAMRLYHVAGRSAPFYHTPNS